MWLGGYQPDHDANWKQWYEQTDVIKTKGRSVLEGLEAAFQDDQVSSTPRRSLTIGDVLVGSDGQAWLIAATGFVPLPSERTLHFA